MPRPSLVGTGAMRRWGREGCVAASAGGRRECSSRCWRLWDLLRADGGPARTGARRLNKEAVRLYRQGKRGRRLRRHAKHSSSGADAGPTHPGVATSLNNLAASFKRRETTRGAAALRAGAEDPGAGAGADAPRGGPEPQQPRHLLQATGSTRGTAALRAALKIQEQALGRRTRPWPPASTTSRPSFKRRETTRGAAALRAGAEDPGAGVGADAPGRATTLNNLALVLQATGTTRGAAAPRAGAEDPGAGAGADAPGRVHTLNASPCSFRRRGPPVRVPDDARGDALRPDRRGGAAVYPDLVTHAATARYRGAVSELISILLNELQRQSSSRRSNTSSRSWRSCAVSWAGRGAQATRTCSSQHDVRRGGLLR